MPKFRKDPTPKKSYKGVTISHPYSPKPGTPSQASLETLGKFPSESKTLEDRSWSTRGYGPLDSHNSPKPSTNSQPHLPHLSAIPPALHIRKSLPTVSLHTGDHFEEIDLGRLKHYSTEAPPSFVKEVDDKIARRFDVESLYSPDAVEKDYFTNSAHNPEPTRNLSLGSNKGRYAPKRETKALVRNISAGPYSTSDNLTNDEEKEDIEKNMNTHRTLWFLIAFVVGAMAVAGIVLATVAVQRRALTGAMVTVVLGLSSQGATAMETPSLDIIPSSLTSTYDQTTSVSHKSHQSKARMTSSTDVSYEALDSVTEREEAIAWSSSDQTTPCTTTTTETLTSTVYAANTGKERRGVAATTSRDVKGLYAAPDLDAILKRTITSHRPHIAIKVTARQHAESNEKSLLGHPTANAAAPMIAAPSLFRKQMPPPTIPDIPAENWTYLEAYFYLAKSATELCMARETYLGQPAAFHFSEDDEMANCLATSWCANHDIQLSPYNDTATCPGEKEWRGIYAEAKRVCAMPVPKPTEGGVQFTPGVVDALGEFCGGLKRFGTVEGCADSGSLAGMGAKVRRGNSTLGGFTWTRVGSGGATPLATTAGIGKRQAPLLPVQTPAIPVAILPTPPVGPVANLPTPPAAPVANVLPSVIPVASLPTPPPALPPANTITPPGLGVLPTHYSLTPPPSWSTIPMITFPSQAVNSDYESKYFPTNTIPASLSYATPPPYTGPKMPSKSWADNYPFPIPTGYVSPNIVPKDEQVGVLTFNIPGTGACGVPAILDNEFAVAISWVLFDIGREIGGSSLERNWDSILIGGISYQYSALCNRWINVWMDDGKGGKSVQHPFVVRDRCAACNVTDLDIQTSVFERVWADTTLGRVQVTWEWMQEAPTSLPGSG